MNKYLKNLIGDYKPSGNLDVDYKSLLMRFEKRHTVEHCSAVAHECERIALLFGADSQKAKVAGYFHDISAIIKGADRIEASEALGIELFEEERALPMITHQKLSVEIAREVFGIQDMEILSAIGKHTTLHKEYSVCDLIVFIADKIKWDQKNEPPFLGRVMDGLEVSLERAAYEYLDYLLNENPDLKVVHPWARESYEQLGKVLGMEHI